MRRRPGPKSIGYYLRHVALGASMNRIAREKGVRHSTVSRGIRRVEDYRDNPDFDDEIADLEKILREQEGVA